MTFALALGPSQAARLSAWAFQPDFQQRESPAPWDRLGHRLVEVLCVAKTLFA